MKQGVKQGVQQGFEMKRINNGRICKLKNQFLEKSKNKPLTFKLERYKVWELDMELGVQME